MKSRSENTCLVKKISRDKEGKAAFKAQFKEIDCEENFIVSESLVKRGAVHKCGEFCILTTDYLNFTHFPQK